MQVAIERPVNCGDDQRKKRYEEIGRSKNREECGKSIQSVDRALSIIEILSLSSNPLRLNEISTAADLNLSTCHHLIKTLVMRGYVINAGRNQGYSLSPRIENLWLRSRRDFNLVEFARPSLQKLNEDTRESVLLAVLRGSSLITQLCIASPLRSEADAYGTVNPRAAHALALGKAILAWLPEGELTRVVADNGLPGFTEQTITSLPALAEELRLVRRSGFALEDGEFRDELVGLGAPVRDASGAIVGSIGITIGRRRASETYRQHIVQAVTRCARDLSARMPAGCFT